MTDSEPLKILKENVEAWNKWPGENPELKIELSNTNLIGINIIKAHLSHAKLILVNLIRDSLRGFG